MIKIEFLSVFEARRGLGLLRMYGPSNTFGLRDHNYGSLKYEITDSQLRILKENNVGVIILDGDGI